MKTPHKYVEVIKAWAEGSTIQWRNWEPDAQWNDWVANTTVIVNNFSYPMRDAPTFTDFFEYRVKPELPGLPTLAQVARNTYEKNRGSVNIWYAVVYAVKEALRTGEYKEI